MIPWTKKSWKGVSINHIVKLSIHNYKNSILVIKNQNLKTIRLKATTERKKVSEV